MLEGGLSSISCAESQDTGYSKGNAFAITVVTVDGKKVETATANAYYVMAQAAAKAGVTLKVVSGFRTMAEQKYLYGCYVNCNCNNCNLAAKPGYSNHQSGHALDLNTSSGGVLAWLNAHGGAYGFKRTVPSEAWHWEWWGGGPGGGPCGQTCECTPGQTQSQGCGLCGSRHRTCGSGGNSCHWGSWTGCQGEGPCSPGQTQTEGCGKRCGHRSRSCGGGCQWGGWTGCQGEGPCVAGAVETEGCGNCGHHARTCTPSCLWSEYSPCADQGPCAPGQLETKPCGECGYAERVCGETCQMGEYGKCAWLDPEGGTKACSTSLLGACAPGLLKCLAGTVACVGSSQPAVELCDDVDNDCDGASDEPESDGTLPSLGDSAPAFAATSLGVEVPGAIDASADGVVTVRYRNVGAATWPAGLVVLRALGPAAGLPSLLVHPNWPGLNTPAIAAAAVPPGAESTLSFPIRAPTEPGTVSARFRLVHTGAASAFRCPSTEVAVTVTINRRPPDLLEDPPEEEPVDDTPVPEADVGLAAASEPPAAIPAADAGAATGATAGTCQTTPTPSSPRVVRVLVPLLMLLLALALTRRSERPR